MRRMFEVVAAGRKKGCPRVFLGLGTQAFPRFEFPASRGEVWGSFLGSRGSRISIRRPRLSHACWYLMMDFILSMSDRHVVLRKWAQPCSSYKLISHQSLRLDSPRIRGLGQKKVRLSSD